MATTGVTVRVEYADVVRALEGIKNGAPRAATRAINRTMVTWNAQAARLIAKDIGLKVGVVKSALRIVKATFSHLVGSVVVTGRRIPLIEFGARGPEPSRGRGKVTYRIGGRGRTTVPGAFITTLRSGHRGVFARIGTSVRRSVGGWSLNLPIVELRGPSLPKVAANQAITAAFDQVVDEAFQKNLLHDVKFLLENRKGA